MRTKNYAAVATLSAIAIATATGTANANPVPAPPAPAPVVNDATAFLSAAAHQVLDPTAARAPVALAIPTGTITVGGGQIGMTGPNGIASVGAPLAPVSAALAPVAPALLRTVDSALPAPATANPVAGAIPGVHQAAESRFKTWNEREQWEFGRMMDGISLASTIGGATGAVVGGTIGCLAGAAAAQVVTPVDWLAGPLVPLGAGFVGCALGASAIGAITAVAVAGLVTLPVFAITGANYVYQAHILPFEAPPQ